jgi:hypothetical protein
VSATNELASLFRRDLAKLSKQIEVFPDSRALWQTVPGVLNAAGNLALHIEGNLREYVGRQLGNLPYRRNRELEFSAKGLSKDELSERLAQLGESIPTNGDGISGSGSGSAHDDTGISHSSLWAP